LIADTYLSVGTPVQMALPGLLQAGAAIRRQILERVQRNRQALAKALGAHSPCTLLPAEAGWCAILRVPEIMSDEAWASALLEQDSVLVQPGYFFDLTMGATLVLSLIVQESIFAEAWRDCLRAWPLLESQVVQHHISVGHEPPRPGPAPPSRGKSSGPRSARAAAWRTHVDPPDRDQATVVHRVEPDAQNG